MPVSAVKPATFELKCRREAWRKEKGKMVRDHDRDPKLPDEPAGFTSIRGDYPTVSAQAVRLNETQLRSGFLDHLFFPELV